MFKPEIASKAKRRSSLAGAPSENLMNIHPINTMPRDLKPIDLTPFILVSRHAQKKHVNGASKTQWDLSLPESPFESTR
jgi:hypothetical protein